MMKRVTEFLKKEPMLLVSASAAILSLFISPPDRELLGQIDWHTLGILFMMLTVLEGFKRENLFLPLIRLSSRFSTMVTLSLFLVFGVFCTSMFVTNDVSLIIFVPLTILLFRGAGREECILPVISMENIAAIRGSLLMPFGSPQNLFLYQQSGTSAANFILHMSPLCISSAVLLICFILIYYRKEKGRKIELDAALLSKPWEPDKRVRRIAYSILFVLILLTIVSRTKYWLISLLIVTVTILVVNRKLFGCVDYVLLVTFFCFFVFSSSVTRSPGISEFLKNAVAGREYFWVIGLSQIISNVPASIVLYPFTENFAGLIYGADTAGLVSLIGSLASVINYRIYVREYPGNGLAFIRTFMKVSLAFFVIVVVPGYLLSSWKFF